MSQLNVKPVKAPAEPLRLMYRVYKYVLPDVAEELQSLRERAMRIPDPELRRRL